MAVDLKGMDLWDCSDVTDLEKMGNLGGGGDKKCHRVTVSDAFLENFPC